MITSFAEWLSGKESAKNHAFRSVMVFHCIATVSQDNLQIYKTAEKNKYDCRNLQTLVCNLLHGIDHPKY